MRASQLLDLLQGQTFDPGGCRMGLQGHRSVLEPTAARVLGSAESLSQQAVKGNKVIIETPFRGNTKHKDDFQGEPITAELIKCDCRGARTGE